MGGSVKERSLSFRGVPTVRARVTKHQVQKSRGEWHVPSFRCGEAKNGPWSCSVHAVRHLRHHGGGVAGSVTLFETREAAEAANEKALAWIRGSLSDLIDGDPEVIAGEVLAAIAP